MPAGIETQNRNCLDRIKATLASEGLTMVSVVSATCFPTDTKDFAAFNTVYTEYFSDPQAGPHHGPERADDRRLRRAHSDRRILIKPPGRHFRAAAIPMDPRFAIH